MNILRVDDRLIHGQVVAGWARPLGIRSLILVSDQICKDEWACNAYRLAIPEGIEFLFVSIKECMPTLDKLNKKNVMIIGLSKGTYNGNLKQSMVSDPQPDAYLQKPLDVDKLLDTVKEFIE